jgi:DNA-binding transcriptional LysR family regulator
LVAEVIFDEELVILTSPLVENFRSLEKARIIMLGQGSNYGLQLKTILAQHGCPTSSVMELGTVENILECVGLGLGITLLPESLAATLLKKGQLRAHRVPHEECRVQTLFIRRRDGFVSSALSAFLDCARSYAAEQVKKAAA